MISKDSENWPAWSLTNDRSWFLRTALSYVVVLTLMYLFFIYFINYGNNIDATYDVCAVLSFLGLVFIVVSGPTLRPKWTRNDDERLLMLPTSNLEKYLMRYCYWLLLLPLFLLSFVVADGVQYVVNTLLGHEWTGSVIDYLLHPSSSDIPAKNRVRLFRGLLILALWVHSLYAVGGSFFRSHKYSWILTSVVLVAALMLTAALNLMQMINQSWWNYMGYYNPLLLVLSVFNFWLSYRLFCRQQLIGKFINL